MGRILRITGACAAFVIWMACQSAAQIGQAVPGMVVRHGNTHVKTVMLTFDDGPHPLFTPNILAVLRKYDVKATFFVVGKVAAKYPQLVRAIAADGHVVANHTYDHIRLRTMPENVDLAEMQRCSDLVQSIIGKRPLYFRPPGGRFDQHVVEAAAKLGLRVVSYSVNTFDTIDRSRYTIAARVVRDVRGGGIVLCHDGFQQTIDALPQIINRLRAKGYTFTTLDHAGFAALGARAAVHPSLKPEKAHKVQLPPSATREGYRESG